MASLGSNFRGPGGYLSWELAVGVFYELIRTQPASIEGSSAPSSL